MRQSGLNVSFFSAGSDVRVFSCYVDREGAILVDETTRRQIAAHYRGERLGLLPSAHDGLLRVPWGILCLPVGAVVQFTEPFVLDAHSVIEAGECGVVSTVEATGERYLQLQKPHSGLLGYWGNQILLVPFETDDILTVLTPQPAGQPANLMVAA